MRMSPYALTLAVLVVHGIPGGLGASAARAQAELGGSGEADIELGATQPSEVETGIGTETRAQRAGGGAGGADQVRLGMQFRLNAANVLEGPGEGPDVVGASGSNVIGNSVSDSQQVPVVTPGIRLLDGGKLFVGAGLGFTGYSFEEADGEETSRSGFTLSPLGSFDVISSDVAALSLLGWLNLSSLGESETCDDGDCVEGDNDAFGWGLNLGAGVRGFISEGLAIGGEFGWGFTSWSADTGGDWFGHGLFGSLLVEASIGL